MKSFISTFLFTALGVSSLVLAAPATQPESDDVRPSLLSDVGDAVRDTKASVDGVVGSTLAGATGILEGFCSAEYKCEVNVTGPITSLLIDGGNYSACSYSTSVPATFSKPPYQPSSTNADCLWEPADQVSIAGWCDKGHCYAGTNNNLALPQIVPFDITCDNTTPNGECKGTLAGDVKAIFDNGNEVELWGWLTPSGYCKGGVCVASINALGDPAYK